jgi:hypothetical protein
MVSSNYSAHFSAWYATNKNKKVLVKGKRRMIRIKEE